MLEIRFATSNPHKVSEGNLVGKGFGIEFIQIDVPYPEVRDENVSVVAEEGAKFVYSKINEPVVVEDTGLFIDALNGFPGPYSAYVYRKVGCEGILKLLAGTERRSAHFTSAVGFCSSKGVRVFEGTIKGRISEKMRGNLGFGYDPIFIPEGYSKTFAEDHQLKTNISHRRLAFQRFCEWITAEGI